MHNPLRPAQDGPGSALLFVWAAALAVFLVLGLRLSTGRVMITDMRLTAHIRSDLPSALEPWLRLTNRLGDPLPFALVVLGLAGFCFLRLKLLEGDLLLLSALPCAAGFAAKQLFQATPPNNPPVVAWFHSYSYPSGHVVGVTVLCGLVWFLAGAIAPWRPAAWALRLAAFAFAASIGLARVWVNAHWTSDVLGGYLFALLFLLPAYAFYQARRQPDTAETADAGGTESLRPALKLPH